MTTMTELFGEPIHVYTRAEAIADGVLIDLTPLARGIFKIPVACTAGVWALIEGEGETAETVATDILTIFALGPPFAREVDARTRVAGISLVNGPTDLRMVCGPGDDAEPVLTIMLPEED